jgi:hypothetical protein
MEWNELYYNNVYFTRHINDVRLTNRIRFYLALMCPFATMSYVIFYVTKSDVGYVGDHFNFTSTHE